MSDHLEFATLEWRKSSFSGDNGCVETATYQDSLVAVRDSKDPASGVQLYTPHEWHSFLQGVRNNEFDDLVPRPASTTSAG
jgi:Domain of unknown function (DUF397)